MGKAENKDITLAWTKMVPASEGQDPLGLQLRVTARLGADLFHCITSITPRARYYSILPFTIIEAQDNFPGSKLREAVRKIEKAFTTGCILNHQGAPCDGGGLVGSDILKPWFEAGHSASTWPGARFAVNPALDAYFTSLVNFHLFVGKKPSDINDEIEETSDWDGTYELTEIGADLVSSYKSAIAGIGDISRLGINTEPKLDYLKTWGEIGGLCELKSDTPDCRLLEDLFLNRVNLPEEAHNHRRDSLILLLYLADFFAHHGVKVDALSLGTAVYFGSIYDQSKQAIPVSFPDKLEDSKCRWQMFYFHRYLSYGLEYLFSNLVYEANREILKGVSLDELMAEWSSPLVTSKLNMLLGLNIDGSYISKTPNEIFQTAGLFVNTSDKNDSIEFDESNNLEHQLSEHGLFSILRKKEVHLSPESSVLSILLCIVTVMRYQRWNAQDYGNWLAQATGTVQYENVTVPVVSEEWRVRYTDFWNTPIYKLAHNLMQKFVINLHLSLAYQKSGAHFYIDANRIVGRDKLFDIPELSNPRLRNAIQIINDLGLLESDTENHSLQFLANRGKEVLEEFV